MNTKNVITWFVPIILFIINICVTYILPQFYNKNNDRQLGYLIFYLIFSCVKFLFKVKLFFSTSQYFYIKIASNIKS